ncbi:MAG: precorrin-6A reductase [Ruminiclostridium sp.]|nr:precorrin-6A reductase [Ruminiclostridium sp.]
MKLLIFGGTTEGRELSEWCAANGIFADVSVTTDYGARLLGNGEFLNVFTGKLACGEMKTLIGAGDYAAVIDATHPYATEATANIREACEASGVRYFRLLRSGSELHGVCVSEMSGLVDELNKTDKTILSTLGAKELPELAEVRRPERVWLRVLPADGIEDKCAEYGFERSHVIVGKGPFTVGENTDHIRKSGAQILVTKESGAVGGYPEKCEAARVCGIETITLTRPQENGFSFEELTDIISSL